MSESEAPLTPDERLAIAALYASLTVSQNRTVPGRLDPESACCADLNIRRPETLSHREIPANRVAEGFRMEEAC